MVNNFLKITIVLLGFIISCFSNAQVEYKAMDNVSVNDSYEELLLPELQANIDSYKLQGFIKLERKDNEFKLFYNDDYTIKREPEFFINLVKFHNDTAVYSSTSYISGLPYEILRFLVEYTIYHKDAFLLDYLLGDK